MNEKGKKEAITTTITKREKEKRSVRTTNEHEKKKNNQFVNINTDKLSTNSHISNGNPLTCLHMRDQNCICMFPCSTKTSDWSLFFLLVPSPSNINPNTTNENILVVLIFFRFINERTCTHTPIYCTNTIEPQQISSFCLVRNIIL